MAGSVAAVAVGSSMVSTLSPVSCGVVPFVVLLPLIAGIYALVAGDWIRQFVLGMYPASTSRGRFLRLAPAHAVGFVALPAVLVSVVLAVRWVSSCVVGWSLTWLGIAFAGFALTLGVLGVVVLWVSHARVNRREASAATIDAGGGPSTRDRTRALLAPLLFFLPAVAITGVVLLQIGA